MPGLAVDAKGGVHMVYAENVTTTGIRNGDIKYVNSDDCRKGSKVDRCSWNAPITINLDTTNRDQFMPTVHVSNITSSSAPMGVIYVTALDRRNDPANVTWQVWSYTCSPGASLSSSGSCRSADEWSNMLVSDDTIDNHDQNFIGDYNGITHTKTKEAYVVWVDDRQFDAPGNKGFDIYGDWSKR